MPGLGECDRRVSWHPGRDSCARAARYAYPRVSRSGGRFGFDIGYEMYDALGIYDPSVTSRSKKLAADTRSYRDSA